MKFFEELKKRNVYKAGAAYLVTSWLLLQIVDVVGPGFGWTESATALLTKILIVGFPIVLVIAWLYELTPEGLRRTGKIESSTGDKKRIGRKVNYFIIGILAIAVCLLLADRIFFANIESKSENLEASIAVLPFENMSPNPDNEYFADGISEQILDEIAQISGLKVSARTSSFSFKHKDEDIETIASTLGVNYVLEGSVRYDDKGDKVKITTQLINANDGYHLWSKTYDEDFKQIFRIQENIGREVATELRISLLPEEVFALSDNMTDEPEAYKLYVRAKQISAGENREFRRAIELLNNALELDPQFAEAHAELSFMYDQEYFYGSLEKETRDKKMEYHVEKALEIAPDNPDVLKAKALWKFKEQFEKDSSEVILDLRKVVSSKPNDADAYRLLYQALVFAKQPGVAISYLEKAAALNPINIDVINRMRADAYFYRHDKKGKAIEILDEMITRDSSSGAMLTKALMLTSEPHGDLVEVFKMRYSLLKKEPNRRFYLNHSTLGALDLDLWPLAEKYAHTIRLNHSGTFAIYNNFSSLYYFHRKYPEAKELIEEVRREEILDDETAILDMAWIEYLQGNLDEALSRFESEFPEVASDTILKVDIDDSLAEKISYYSEFLRAAGNIGKADEYAEKYCSFINNDKVITDWSKDQKVLQCYYLSNNKEDFLDYLEDLFFSKRHRLGWFTNMKSGYYILFENDPEYQRLFKKIEAETHRMRAEVIAYLKEEGDWDPAWDKELGLE